MSRSLTQSFTFVEGEVIWRWGIVLVLVLHNHITTRVQFVFVFHSESVAGRQGETLNVYLPREQLEMCPDLLVGPQHHLNCT